MTEPKPPRPPNIVDVKWTGERSFEAGVAGQPTIRMDGHGKVGPGPVSTLLCALAGCTSIDIVEILAKRRTPVESLDIRVVGQRANAVPPRLTSIVLEYTMKGKGIEREQAERAIELSVTKYCSVRDSLDPNMPVMWELKLDNS